jgi:hypothetical protein
MPVAGDAGDGVMAVDENVSLDRHPLAQGALGWKAAGLHLGRDGLDRHAAMSLHLAVRRLGGLNRRRVKASFDG